MASTYVNNLRLEEIGTGEQSGTWGDTTNTNLEIIGQAVAWGTRAIANASTDNITIADGALDADRCLGLKLTGGGQACTVTLLPNTSSKTWFMYNATAADLTFTCGSGANVVIPAGQTKVIATDGLGSGGVVHDLLTAVNLAGTTVVDDLTVSDDLTVGDDLAVTGLATVGGTLGVTGIATFTDDIIIGDGKTIGSASDVDAITIAANGQVTLTQTLIGTALDISGDIDVDGTTNLDVVDIDGAVNMATTALVTGVLTTAAPPIINTGSNGLPSLAFSHSNGGADNFLIGGGVPGTSNSGFSIRDVDASANRIVIDSSGEVGIGIDVPLHALHINASEDAAIPTNAGVGVTAEHQSYFGFHNISNSATYSGIAFETRTSGAARWLIANEWKDTYLGDLVFRTRDGGSSSSERLRIANDGQIYATASLSAGANANMASGFVSDTGAVYTRGVIGSNARSNNGGYLSGLAIVNGDNSANGGGAAGGRIVANVSALVVTSDGNAGDDSGGDLVFSTKPEAGNITEQMRVYSSGGVQIKTGNLVIGTAGKGIDFSAQTASSDGGASTTSELLDHYEEGSWTPSVSSGGVSGTCSYTRIGRMVYITADLTLSGSRGSEAFRVGGLPFAVPRWSPGGFYAQVYTREGTDQISGAAAGGSSNVGFVAFGDEATGDEFGNGYFVFSIWYNL